jgi:signal transduction histidine kinase
MRVGEILDDKGGQLFEVSPDWPVRKAVAMLAAWNVGTTIVTDFEGVLIGIISERDIVRSLNEFGGRVLSLPVSDLMTRSVVTCTSETTVGDALSLMALHRIRHLPVVRDKEILGLISIRDVLEYRARTLEEHFAALVQAEQEATRARVEAELSNRAKTEFLSNISHELKTPLNAVIGFSEVLSNETFARANSLEYAHYLSEIDKNGRRLLDMVNNLLDLSRLQIRALEPAEEVLAIPQLVSTCVHTIGERANRSSVTLRVEAKDALPALSADRRMVKQMVINLLANAIKFTPEGGAVSVHCAAEKDGGIRVCVSDTGIGIAPEQLPKVVQPFYQVEGAINRRYEGVGLGLALVDAMIQAHGGALTLESEIDIGTSATLHFPPERTVAALQHLLTDEPEAA